MVWAPERWANATGRGRRILATNRIARSLRHPIARCAMPARNTQEPRVFIVLRYPEGWTSLRCHSNKEIFGTEVPLGFDFLTRIRCVSLDRAEGKSSDTHPVYGYSHHKECNTQGETTRYEERPEKKEEIDKASFGPRKSRSKMPPMPPQRQGPTVWQKSLSCASTVVECALSDILSAPAVCFPVK